MSPIKNLSTPIPRLGRISLGYKAKTDRGVTHPVKAKTLVFSSDNPRRLEVLSGFYGGTVRKSVDAGPDGADRFVLVSAADECRVWLPSNDLDLVLSEWMELFSASGLKRRCDGETVLTARHADAETGEITRLEDVPCICAEEGSLGSPQGCKPTLRLNVVLPDALEVEGLGVWVVTSTGWRSNSSVMSAIKMLQMFFGERIAGVPLTLGVLEAKAQLADGKVQKYRHFTLNAAVTLAEGLAAAAERRSLGERLIPASLPTGDEATEDEIAAQEVGGEASGEELARRPDASPPAAPAPEATRVQLTNIRRLLKQRNLAESVVADRYQVAAIEQLTAEQANAVLRRLNEKPPVSPAPSSSTGATTSPGSEPATTPSPTQEALT